MTRLRADQDPPRAQRYARGGGERVDPPVVDRVDEHSCCRVDIGQRGDTRGLGLELVKQIVEPHGGWVQARSAGAGEGSGFVVRLPSAGR